jgi:hypothetical protein
LMPAAASESATGVRDAAAVASERVVALLIGSDEKNLTAHRRCPGHITVRVQIQSTEAGKRERGTLRALE